MQKRCDPCYCTVKKAHFYSLFSFPSSTVHIKWLCPFWRLRQKKNKEKSSTRSLVESHKGIEDGFLDTRPFDYSAVLYCIIQCRYAKKSQKSTHRQNRASVSIENGIVLDFYSGCHTLYVWHSYLPKMFCHMTLIVQRVNCLSINQVCMRLSSIGEVFLLFLYTVVHNNCYWSSWTASA